MKSRGAPGPLFEVALSATAVLALALGTAACAPMEPDLVGQEVGLLQSWTLEPGGRLVGSMPIRRGDWSVETSWEVELRQPWAVYREALERGAPGYLRETASGAGLSFVKRLGEDTWRVLVEVVSHGPPLRVRVTFTARVG